MKVINCTTVWFELYLDWSSETSGTTTRLYSLDEGIQKPDMAPTLLSSVYLMLTTETLIETLIEEVKWYSKWFLLYHGRYRAFSSEPGSHFYCKDIIFPILSLSRAACLFLSLFVSVCNLFVNFKCTCIQKHKNTLTGPFKLLDPPHSVSICAQHTHMLTHMNMHALIDVTFNTS